MLSQSRKYDLIISAIIKRENKSTKYGLKIKLKPSEEIVHWARNIKPRAKEMLKQKLFEHNDRKHMTSQPHPGAMLGFEGSAVTGPLVLSGPGLMPTMSGSAVLQKPRSVLCLFFLIPSKAMAMPIGVILAQFMFRKSGW